MPGAFSWSRNDVFQHRALTGRASAREIAVADYAFRSSISRWRTLAWTSAAALMLLPALAMRVSAKVSWSASDFAVFGAMLLAALGAFELMLRAGGTMAYRLGAAAMIGGLFLLVWIDAAVGFIGSENNGANLMYVGVIATALGGAALVRFRPAGMVRVMLATTAMQTLVAVVALLGGLGMDGHSWPRDVIGGTAVFDLVWLGAAMLFWRATHD